MTDRDRKTTLPTARCVLDDVRRPGRRIVVEYIAPDEVADADRLCAWLAAEIERHLLSITEVPVDRWDLVARIETCRMAEHWGSVRVALSGTVAGRPADGLIAVEDQPEVYGWTFEQQREHQQRLAFPHLFTYLARLLVPSELVRALGRRRLSGRLVRAWADACRELRNTVDLAVSRPASGGEHAWRKAKGMAVLAGLGAAVLAVGMKLLFAPRRADDVAQWVGCGLIACGVFGSVAAAGLLMLPARFYQAERAGIELARLFGVKGLGGIRVVAGGLLLVSVLIGLVSGTYLLLWN